MQRSNRVADWSLFQDCYGFPRGGMCHLLDRYAQGLRRDDGFNGGLCAKLDDPNDKKGLTPEKHGGGQNGYPQQLAPPLGVGVPASAEEAAFLRTSYNDEVLTLHEDGQTLSFRRPWGGIAKNLQRWWMDSQGKIRNQHHPSRCLDKPGHSNVLYVYTCHGADNQKW